MKSHSFFSIIDQFFSVGFSFFFFITVSRVFGLPTVGSIQFCITAASLILAFTNLGVSVISNRQVAKNPKNIDFYLKHSLLIRCVICFPLTFIIAYFSFPLFQSTDIFLYLLVLLYSFLLSILILVNGMLTSLNKIKQVFLINLLSKLLCVLICFFTFIKQETIFFMLYSFCFINLGIIIYQISFSSNFFKKEEIKLSCRKAYILAKKSLSYVLIAVTELVSLRVDVIIIGYLLTAVSVGIYSTAFQFYLASVLLPLALTRIFFVRFTNLNTDKNNFLIAKFLFLKIHIIIIAYAMIVSLLLFFFGIEIIVFVFGEEFIGAAQPLTILCFGILFLSLNRLLLYTLISDKEDKYYLKISLLSAVFNIMLNFLLVPSHGILGAAFSKVITDAMLFTLAAVKLYPRYFKSAP